MAAKQIETTPAKFDGFPKDAMGFWHELTVEMNKEWFEANKARYETQWVAPFHALLAEVSAKLAPAYRGTSLGAPKVMRIYRDTRFSKDKTPYKTWIGGGVSLGGDKPTDGVAALYAHFGVGEDFVGAGHYVFDADTLVKWRKRVADGKTGPAVAKLIAGLKQAKYKVHSYETFARVPKPYDAEHPRAELLKMKGLVVGFPAIPKGLIHKATFVDWLAKHAAAAAPLGKWLHNNL
jgi:uncharacterized protein (TIGR02453 family)